MLTYREDAFYKIFTDKESFTLVNQANSTPSFQEISKNSEHEHRAIKAMSSYKGDISSFEASQKLEGKEPGSYLIRWNSSTERFACHVVQRGGHVEENPFSYDIKEQCWKNGAPNKSWQDLEGIFEHQLDGQIGLPV